MTGSNKPMLSKEDWESAFTHALHEEVAGSAQQSWLTRQALWVPADRIDSGIRNHLKSRVGLDHRYTNAFACIEQLIQHDIVPVPRATALLWRRQNGSLTMAHIMLLEVNPRLAGEAISQAKMTCWQLDVVEDRQLKLQEYLRSDTKAQREKRTSCGSSEKNSLAILSRCQDPELTPEAHYIVLNLSHDPSGHQ